MYINLSVIVLYLILVDIIILVIVLHRYLNLYFIYHKLSNNDFSVCLISYGLSESKKDMTKKVQTINKNFNIQMYPT